MSDPRGASERIPTTHTQLVKVSAERYLDHLAGLNSGNDKVTAAAHALSNSILRACAAGTALAAEDVEFDKYHLGALAAEERELFVNEYALGLGRDDAEVVVMGTEHAYNISIPAEVVNFSLESCASQILWLSGGPSDLVEKIAGAGYWPPGNRRPHHIHPNDYYLVHMQAGRRTWPTLAEILGCAIHSLGDVAYQLELSAYPSRTSKGGRPASEQRLRFLELVLRELRQNARTLIFHGAKNTRLHASQRERLARVFLGLPDGASITFSVEDGIDIAHADGRAVAISPALNNSGIRKNQYPRLQAILQPGRRLKTTQCASTHPPLGHPVAAVLPARTRMKLLSAISEDKLSWDCFFELRRKEVLGRVIGSLFNEVSSRGEATLVMWGHEIGPLTHSRYSPLDAELRALEAYNDGKSQGQLTEPDVIVVGPNWLAILECKRGSEPDYCSRFKDRRCPELHLDRRKRNFCQYWDRGLQHAVTYSRPVPTADSMPPLCSPTYQLMRNALVGQRLAKRLHKRLHLGLVKSPASAKHRESEAIVDQFNNSLRPGQVPFRIISWESLQATAQAASATILEHYLDCFS